MRQAFAGAAAMAALLFGAGSAAAQGPAPDCVTRGELRTLVGFALPFAVRGLGDACRATLGPDAFLVRQGPSLVQRYRADSGVSWAEAKPIVERVSGQRLDKGLGLGEATQRGIVEGMISGMVSDKVKPKDCVTADLAMELLSPLPARNISGLTALLVQIASREEARKGKSRLPFTVCRGEDRR